MKRSLYAAGWDSSASDTWAHGLRGGLAAAGFPMVVYDLDRNKADGTRCRSGLKLHDTLENWQARLTWSCRVFQTIAPWKLSTWDRAMF